MNSTLSKNTAWQYREENLNTLTNLWRKEWWYPHSHNFGVKVVYRRIFYRLQFRKMIITSGKLKAVSSPPFWEGCWETGGPADGMEEELGGLTTGCPSPLPLGCGCPVWFRRCNSCVSLSLWWSVAVLAAIGLLGVGSTVTKIMSIHNFNIHQKLIRGWNV